MLIEMVDENGTEWGVSLDGTPNPEAEQYIECASKDDAVRLQEYVRNISRSVNVEGRA